jgi:hypothetical protein
MSTEHGVGLISAGRSPKDLKDEEIIAFWKSNPSFRKLGKRLGVSRRVAWEIIRKIGEAHPDEEMQGRPWSRLKTSEKIVKSINRLRTMQPEQEAALLRVWEGSSSEKKAEIKKNVQDVDCSFGYCGSDQVYWGNRQDCDAAAPSAATKRGFGHTRQCYCAGGPERQ